MFPQEFIALVNRIIQDVVVSSPVFRHLGDVRETLLTFNRLEDALFVLEGNIRRACSSHVHLAGVQTAMELFKELRGEDEDVMPMGDDSLPLRPWDGCDPNGFGSKSVPLYREDEDGYRYECISDAEIDDAEVVEELPHKTRGSVHPEGQPYPTRNCDCLQCRCSRNMNITRSFPLFY